MSEEEATAPPPADELMADGAAGEANEGAVDTPAGEPAPDAPTDDAAADAGAEPALMEDGGAGAGAEQAGDDLGETAPDAFAADAPDAPALDDPPQTLQIDLDEDADVKDQLIEALNAHAVTIMELFRDWDDDDDGCVDKKEFRKAMQELGFDAPREVRRAARARTPAPRACARARARLAPPSLVGPTTRAQRADRGHRLRRVRPRPLRLDLPPRA